MPIQFYRIPEWIRQKAHQVGEGRADQAEAHGREDYFKSYSSMERNWQGALAEIFLNWLYPWLELTQPLIAMEEEITSSDFVYHGGTEVKCRRFLGGRLPPFGFFKNVQEHRSKGHLSKVLVATSIDGHPRGARGFTVYGWVPIEEIENCRIYTKEDSENIISPAFGVPFSLFRDMKNYFDREDILLSDFLR